MSKIQDYSASGGKGQRLETFSYLPEMDAKRIRRQVEYILKQGWDPAIEHVEPDRVSDHYWYLWKLPMFSVRDVDAVLAELAECHKANPGNHVRLIGLDNIRQTQGASMVVYRGGDG